MAHRADATAKMPGPRQGLFDKMEQLNVYNAEKPKGMKAVVDKAADAIVYAFQAADPSNPKDGRVRGPTGLPPL
jgi:hypothetical protein